MNDPALLRIRDLCVDYRIREGPLGAVRDVSMEVAPGEIVALVGESGSGKTSLARAVLGLVAPSSGRVLLRGEDLERMDARRRRRARKEIQGVFQDPLASLSPRRTVLQSLLEPLDHFGVGERQERRDMAVRSIRAVELDESLLERYPHELSGGQRQRVALARALAPEPSLIVADEPLSSLDLPVQALMLTLIRKLRDDRGVAFLFISHDLSSLRRLADRVAVMYLGGIVESGPAKRVLAEAAHPYTRALLAAVPLADPRQPAPRVLPGEPPSPLTPPSGCVFHKRCTEALARCESDPPVDSVIAPGDSSEIIHRVKCHLWKS